MNDIADPIVAALLATAGGSLLVALYNAVQSYLGVRRLRQEQEPETAEDRVQRLTAALRESTHTIEEIERELRERQQLAAQLQEDVETYQRLKDMSEQEVEAIVEVLGGEVRREGRRNLWANLGFFVLGVISSAIISLVLGG